MIRLGDLRQYRPLGTGFHALFPLESARNVRITFNAPQRTQVHVVPLGVDDELMTDDAYFLCVADGLVPVEFYALGAFALVADADVYWQSYDGQEVHIETTDPVSFVKLEERRALDPNVAAMQAMIYANQERLMAPLYADLERRRYDLDREREALASGAGGGGADSVEPEPPAGVGGAGDTGASASGTGGSGT